MLKQYLLLAAIAACLKVLPNAAMPGFWDNGNGSEFYPLVLQDSSHVGEIQMQSEEIAISLYPGFAVVKGVYHMLNTTNKPVSITTGYPINGSVSQKEVYAIHLSDIYGLKVLVNDSAVNTFKIQGDNSVHSTQIFGHSDNWYVWQNTYAPKQITTLTVYFIVNTQNAVLRHGYSIKKGNAFTYILESGRAWKDSIEKGEIKIWLQGGLRTKDVIGVIPYDTLLANDTFMYYSFTGLEPMPENNIVIWYKKLQSDFNFDSVLKNTAACYKQLDELKEPPAPQHLKKIKAKNFEVSLIAIGDGSSLPAIKNILLYAMAGVLILALVLVLAFTRRRTKATL